MYENKRANWAHWSIEHRLLIYFFAALIFVSGLYSFSTLGRSEDPNFTVKQMIVSAAWPGASAKDVEKHLTDKLEKQIQQLPNIDKITSYSRAGTSVITVYIKDEVRGKDVRNSWLELRNLIEDGKRNLPEGIYGPYYNDRFDDVYGNIYALTGEGFSYEELRQQAEKIKLHFYSIPDVKKVSLVGMQSEKIFIQMDVNKMAQLSLDINTLAAQIKSQTAMVPTGMLETDKANSYIRLSGLPDGVEQIKSIPISANGQVFRLGDIAQIKRDYLDPPEYLMYMNGKPALGIAVSMEDRGNNIQLGENLAQAVEIMQQELPLGLELEKVANQPEVVKKSISEFTESLWEAILIVLVVSLFSLGRRSGYVISCCIPLILLGTFAFMYIASIDLQKISLGTLVLSLGMLVDDAIVVVELMEVKMSEGWQRKKAAAYAFETCGRPLLTGTVITCLGFMPIYFSNSTSSEFVSSLFPVMTVTLLLSWLVSATLAPVLGYTWIKPTVIKEESYDTPFYQKFRQVLDWSLDHRTMVILLTTAAFCSSLFMLNFVRRDFFPASVRPELLVEVNTPEGSSIKATDKAAQELTAAILKDKDLDHVSTYVGQSSPRFVLVMDPVQPRTNYAQLVVVAKDIEARERLEKKILSYAADSMPEITCFTKDIPLGPPSPYPVMLRVYGPDASRVKEIAQQVRSIMAAHKKVNFTRLDWLEESNKIQLSIDNDKLLQLGITRQTVASAIYAQVSGYSFATYLEGDQEIGIVFRINPADREDTTKLENMVIPTSKGAIPLSQVAKISHGTEDNIIWHYNLQPCITVNGGIVEGVTGNDVTMDIYKQTEQLRKALPFGYKIEIAGGLENSTKTLKKIMAPVPAMLLLIMVLIMIQLQDIHKLIAIMLTAPLGIIGVIIGLLIFRAPLGFMAELGIMALTGTIIRNSMVIVDQIDQHLALGMTPLQAVKESAIVRFRPIMLAAFTTILGLIPLFFSEFWNSMAVTIACGLTGATLLTLIVLPVLYAIIFRMKK